MKIGIDISQIVYEGTGVATYVREIVRALLILDQQNEYVLFGASLRRQGVLRQFVASLPRTVRLILVPVPPKILDVIWNRFHIVPVEWFTGPLDVFWSSDWTQPPLAHAEGVTTIHDLIALKYPKETGAKIVTTHKRKLQWVAKECKAILCDSESTKKDVKELLNIQGPRLHVVYPGFNDL
ncbi:MAG: Glycosyl transferase group 1 [Candidatus Gottesmanbacteria bacterium GW2011_GWA2_47_9]|uniref:Glycosyl transferase group 1 n=2 Tax=Microgenomates group TaxID=1794810 RepID=A0A0G1X2A6_9BACT|nr:MAG: Glycosyl transferase group 1 [Candidatus Woesebacteria bacterium GW2011_GWA1_43_12]KKU88580.1 MAG: Glycosyl transferase group 1 [Candidatus Gottesmanbacteria bacterium GW2011_GWA2_47_9]